MNEQKTSHILIRLPEGERFALRLELLKKHQTVQGFLRKIIQKEIGEDTSANTK